MKLWLSEQFSTAFNKNDHYADISHLSYEFRILIAVLIVMKFPRLKNFMTIFEFSIKVT